MRCLSDVCDELEDNPIDSPECAKCKEVSHNIPPNSMADFYLQRDITCINVYCSQDCMVSMDQATPMGSN